MKPEDINGETINKYYHTQGLPLKETAKMIGCGVDTLRLRMMQLNIPVRSLSDSRKGNKNPNYQGGSKKGWSGTIHIIEKKIGRKLKGNELPHHINGDSTDNRPNNLYLCKNRDEHNAIHHQAYEFAKSHNLKSGEMEGLIKEDKIGFDGQYYAKGEITRPNELPSYEKDSMTRDILYDLYWNQGYTLKEIALIFGYTNNATTIRKKMIKYKIKRRPYGSWTRGKYP